MNSIIREETERESMNVIVVGLGSMGRRRIRLIKRYDGTMNITGVDPDEKRRRQTEEMYSISTYENIENALNNGNADCFFVSSSPLSHADITYECLKAGGHVFSELNLVTDRYDENIALADKRGVVLFLSSTQLYRDELLYISKRIHGMKDTCNYMYHVGQYLPDWHPWENYKDYFVGKKRTNACREIMAVEFPWLVETFGPVKNVYVQTSKNSDLDIDYNDNYIISVEHENGHKGVFVLDILCRISVRSLEVFSENMYLRWSGTPESLYEYQVSSGEMKQIILYDQIDKLKEYNETIIENDYYSEIEEFFGVVKGDAVPRYSFEKDRAILGLIDEIESKD